MTATTSRSTSRIFPARTASCSSAASSRRKTTRTSIAFRDIVDLTDGRHLFTVEHEIRSATHPMFMRPLINRNPAVTNRTYAEGHEQWDHAMGPDQYDGR